MFSLNRRGENKSKCFKLCIPQKPNVLNPNIAMVVFNNPLTEDTFFTIQLFCNISKIIFHRISKNRSFWDKASKIF